MGGFKTNSGQVNPGDAVTAGVTNNLPGNAFNNTQHLKDIIDLAGTGETIFAREVRVESDALVGMPVYFNSGTGQFERGLAGVDQDLNTLSFTTTESSHIWGVVFKKCSEFVADILLFGYAELDISGVIEQPTADAGLYYLSQVTPGFMTRAVPPINIPVLRSDGQGRVYVNPQWRDVIEDHIHYKFDLVAEPAGDFVPTVSPTVTSKHTIDNPDSSLPGWLPADDPIFAGQAPSGAKFGYNLSQHPELDSVWPPLPLNGVSLVWDRGNLMHHLIFPHGTLPVFPTEFKFILPPPGGQEVSQSSVRPLAVIDANGIWWMSNCYAEIPWPNVVQFRGSASTDFLALSVPGGCPRVAETGLILYFPQAKIGSSGTVVTSIRAVEGSRLSITCFPEGTSEESTGDLQIDLDLDFETGPEDTEGHVVFKGVTENVFDRGPVVEGIKAGSSAVNITSLFNRIDPGDSATIHQGIPTIDFDSDPGGRELNVQLVRLDGVTEEFPEDVQMLGFQPGFASSYRGKINVPSTGTPLSPVLKLKFRLMGRVAGTLTDLDLVVRRIPAAASSTPLPTVDSVLAISTGIAISGVNEYADVESDSFAVVAGDVVVFELARDPVGDGYAGEIDVIQHVGILEAGP
jgi:hypothetical protein